MGGTPIGGKLAADTNKERYGADFYIQIGSRGGRAVHRKPRGFASSRALARRAGRIGGKNSRRNGELSVKATCDCGKQLKMDNAIRNHTDRGHTVRQQDGAGLAWDVGVAALTHQEILEKAIHKAIDGGWDKTVLEWDKSTSAFSMATYYAQGCTPPERMELIFNHDFAKALWGDGEPQPEIPDDIPLLHDVFTLLMSSVPAKEWQRHLQAMVIADDPIAYLGSVI